MKVLELTGVSKDYKLENKEKFTALNDINISFDKGELVSIIGESGSGKSTLMNLIGGLDSDYNGVIKIDGQDLKSFKDKELDDYRKKKIGFVFQSFNLIPQLSVLDNVTIGLTLSNEKESVKNKKAIELLKKLGLEGHIKKKPNQLSGGQKQRVAIARALINDPDIILADEPTGALDSNTTLQILDILKEIADDGKLVIMVTHSEKVAQISSRVVEISDGRIIKDEINESYTPSQNDFTYWKKENDNIDKKDMTTKKKGHLSFISALKLSFHNMWASKTKNILMAIGVSISLIALILMMSFSSGLTGYISDLAGNYSSPTVVTISKSGYDKDGNKIEGSNMLTSNTFSNDDISNLLNDINSYLERKGQSFRVTNEGNDKNVEYGMFMPTFGMGSISYIPTIEGEEDPEPISSSIMFTYTTPPYYTEKNLLTPNGHIPKKNSNEIMISSATAKNLGYGDNLEEIVGKELTLSMIYEGSPLPERTIVVSAVVDVSLFSGMPVMYIDYTYLDSCVKELQAGQGQEITGMSPTYIYIKTDNKKTAEIINEFKNERKDLSGSMEEQLENMFNEMMSTFSIALTVIAGISLAVALIMILVVLYMSVSERTKEIGVLKSIGARKKDIKLIFSTESFLVGVLSGIAGIIFSLIIGGVLTLIFNSMLGFAPIRMMWYYFLEALALSIVISIIAGLYPSSKAAKLDPVESLRHE